MMKTKEEIKTMVEKLKELKPKVRQTSVFGDNHHDAIDAQIRVLEEHMSDDGIEREFAVIEEDENGDETYGVAQNVYDAADMIFQWRDGRKTDEEILTDWPLEADK